MKSSEKIHALHKQKLLGFSTELGYLDLRTGDNGPLRCLIIKRILCSHLVRLDNITADLSFIPTVT